MSAESSSSIEALDLDVDLRGAEPDSDGSSDSSSVGLPPPHSADASVTTSSSKRSSRSSAQKPPASAPVVTLELSSDSASGSAADANAISKSAAVPPPAAALPQPPADVADNASGSSDDDSSELAGAQAAGGSSASASASASDDAAAQPAEAANGDTSARQGDATARGAEEASSSSGDGTASDSDSGDERDSGDAGDDDSEDHIKKAIVKKDVRAYDAVVASAKKRERPRIQSTVLSPEARGRSNTIKVELDGAVSIKSPRLVRVPSTDRKREESAEQQAKSAAAAAKICERCEKNDFVLQLTIEDLFQLRLCTPCAVIIEKDRVDAAKTVERVRGISLNIKERVREQEEAGPYCQRCKKREAFCVTKFPKAKREIMCCPVCFTDHPDFKTSTKYALACVMHADFKEARFAFLHLLRMAPDNAATLYNLACIESLSRNTSAAFLLLDMALERGYYRWKTIGSDPDLERVRNMPAYEDLIAMHKKKQTERLAKKPLLKRLIRGKNRDAIEQ